MRGPSGLLLSLVLSTGLVVGCQSATEAPSAPAGEPPIESTTIELAVDPAAPPHIADMRYLQDPETGEVLLEVPPEVLVQAGDHLRAAGRHAEAEQLAKLYDPATGRVRDLEHAKAAQKVLQGGAR